MVGDDGAAFGVGAGDEAHGAKATDMVPAGLGVVFDGDDAGLGPVSAVADGFDDAAEGKVVVGDAGGWGGQACLGA